MGGRTGLWVGRGMSALVVAFLLFDGATSTLQPQKMATENAVVGFQPWHLPVIGGIALACAAIYAIPRTAMLGAILITGFLGGAICTHFRIGDLGSPPQLISLTLGLLTWGGLWLRNARVRALLPLSS